MPVEQPRREVDRKREEGVEDAKPKKKLSPKAKKKAAQAAKKQAKLDKKAAQQAAKKAKAGKKTKKPKKVKKSKKGEEGAKDGKGGKGGKKKGKLPIIAAIVVVLGAGGFFGLKMASGPAEEPEIELGGMMQLGDFVVNLSGGKYYLQAEITLHLFEGYEHGGGGHGGEEEGSDGLSPVRDAIITVMSSATLEEVLTTAGKEQLKRDLAKAINKAMLATGHDESADPHDEPVAEGEEKEPKHPEWHSQEGPVLMVYFDKFAVQPMRR